MNKSSKILIVGHNDIIEKSLVSYFNDRGFTDVFSSSAMAMDATIQSSVYNFFQQEKPEYVFLGSTRSGGIEANQKNAAEFIYHNLESQNNIVYAAHKFGTKKLLYFTGSCAYPKNAQQPIKEEYLGTGPLERTSEPYSVAKIAGIRLCQAFKKQYGFNAIVAVPSTVYGPGSDTDLEKAHVLGALVAKFDKAKVSGETEVVVWGSGNPRREFLYVDDFVEASVLLMDKYDDSEMINVGCGYDVSIKELAEAIKKVTGFAGNVRYDTTKPDGTMQKLLDVSKMDQLGWKPKVSLEEGIAKTYKWYKESQKTE